MITLKSKASDFIKLCQKQSACSLAVTSMSDKDADEAGEYTVAEGLQHFLDDPAFPEGWGVWVLLKVGNELDEDVRKMLLNKISSPMVAMQTYLKCTHLTEAEDILLKSKFEGKLPLAEKELVEEKIKRAKKCQ